MGALDRDAELRGGRTARLLLVAGALGIFGAVGMILMLSGHPYGHHPPWHVIVATASWSGILVVAIAIALLEVRTPSLPLARAACVGILGLGLAGVCSALCPDQHVLRWWSATSMGGGVAAIGGITASALCFGAMTTLVFGAGAALAALGGTRPGAIRPLLPAAMLVLVLSPGVALQSFGTSWGVFAAWIDLKFTGGATMKFVGVPNGGNSGKATYDTWPQENEWRQRYHRISSHGTAFEGTDGWVHVDREGIHVFPDTLIDEDLEKMSVQLVKSPDHVRNFLDSIKSRKETVCPIDESVRSDSLCHISNIAIRLNRKVVWDPIREKFIGDEEANLRLRSRKMREPWTL